jgi:hypothetical protein
MVLGRAQAGQVFDNPRELPGDRLREGSLYRLLDDHGHAVFPDGYLAYLYSGAVKGRPTVAARLVATVMVLQAFEGLSDRDACDRLEAGLRWQAAAGVDTEYWAFHPTVLVVIASYYALFAVMGASMHALVLESLLGAVFLVAAISGFRSSLWVVVIALAAHGIFDLAHGRFISNPGVPSWWPAFCLAYDITAAAYLAWLLKSGRIRTAN